MLSEIKRFTYIKDGTPEERAVLPVVSTDKILEGLSLDKMTEEDREAVLEAISNFNQRVKPFFEKYYRRFKKESILNEQTEKLY